MDDVLISLSRDELSLLVQLVYTGLTVMDEAGDAGRMGRDRVVDLVLKAAHESASTDGIRFDPALNAYFLEAGTEEILLEPYVEFAEASFWNELATRLARRDLLAEFGEEGLRRMTDCETGELLENRESRYRQEFERNGIANVVSRDTD
jgi:hypothetical protein